MEQNLDNYINAKQLDLLMNLSDLIESSNITNIKMLDVISNDTYRHMHDAGLFDYYFIDRGHSASKGVYNKPSRMNLVYFFYLNILMDLKAFGLNKKKLLKIKSYLFEDFTFSDIINLNVEHLKKSINSMEFNDENTKSELFNKIDSGEFFEQLENKKVSRLFLNIFKLISDSQDIQLFVDVNTDAMFIDDFELNNEDLIDLSKDSRIVIPLKQ